MSFATGFFVCFSENQELGWVGGFATEICRNLNHGSSLRGLVNQSLHFPRLTPTHSNSPRLYHDSPRVEPISMIGKVKNNSEYRFVISVKNELNHPRGFFENKYLQKKKFFFQNSKSEKKIWKISKYFFSLKFFFLQSCLFDAKTSRNQIKSWVGPSRGRVVASWSESE